MVRLAHTLVDTQQRAEEVVQDAFAAIYERYDRLERPEAYLRVSVLNGCRRVLRRRLLRRAQPIPPGPNLNAAHSSSGSGMYNTAAIAGDPADRENATPQVTSSSTINAAPSATRGARMRRQSSPTRSTMAGTTIMCVSTFDRARVANAA